MISLCHACCKFCLENRWTRGSQNSSLFVWFCLREIIAWTDFIATALFSQKSTVVKSFFFIHVFFFSLSDLLSVCLFFSWLRGFWWNVRDIPPVYFFVEKNQVTMWTVFSHRLHAWTLEEHAVAKASYPCAITLILLHFFQSVTHSSILQMDRVSLYSHSDLTLVSPHLY